MSDVRTTRFVIEDSRRAACSPQCLMDQILDATKWPEWQPEIVATEGPERVAPGDVVRGHAEMLGFNVEGHSTATRVTVDGFEEDVLVGVRMKIRYEANASGTGAVVVQTLTSELPTGLAGRLLSFFLRRRLKRMQKTALDELVRQSEASCA